jgi:hypothetical protein
MRLNSMYDMNDKPFFQESLSRCARVRVFGKIIHIIHIIHTEYCRFLCDFAGLDYCKFLEKAILLYEKRNAKSGCFKAC